MTDWVTRVMECGIPYEDDTPDAKKFGKHFVVRFDDDLPRLIKMLQSELSPEAYEEGYKDGWNAGFLEAKNCGSIH